SHYHHFFWEVRAPFHMALDGLFMGFSLAVFYSKVLLEKKLLSIQTGSLLAVSLAVIIVLILGYKEWMNGDNWSQSAVVIYIVSLFFCGIVGIILISNAFVSSIIS